MPDKPHDEPHRCGGDAVDLTAPRALLQALGPRGTARSLVHTLVRPDDQVRLRFELVNGRIEPVSNTIVRLIEDEGILYSVSFGPQHAVEDPIANNTTPPRPAREQRIAAESRISLDIPDGTPFTVATLLDLAAFALHVDRRADGRGRRDTAEPSADVTAIEVPASLAVSPTSAERFTAEPLPITHGLVTELWRARLGTLAKGKVLEPPLGRPVVRAIWSRAEDPAFERPVDEKQRQDLVDQTTKGDATPIGINRLWLSSHGAFYDAEGEWAEGVLASYRHRALTGRDVHVEVVERGYLAPFGHPASITTLTERTFATDDTSDTTASLTQDAYLAITSPTVELPSAFMPNEGRAIPFPGVTATDPGSGPLGRRRIEMPNGSRINPDKAHIVTRDGAEVPIAYSATDRSGHGPITYTLPAVFVSDSDAYEPSPREDGSKTVLAKLTRWYAEDANLAFAEADLGGQAVTWAEASSRGGAGSVQTTNRIRFRLDRPDLEEADADVIEETLRDLARPAFYPAVERAWVLDPSSAATFGGAPAETAVTVAQRYLDHGTDEANIDLGYLDLVEPIQITPTTDATGLFATDLEVETFGQALGAGIELFSDPVWDPTTALAGLPKLLGNLTLADLVGEIELDGGLDAKGLPTMTVEIVPGGVCATFSWEPRLRSFPADAERKTFVVTDDLAEQIPAAKDVFGDGETTGLLSLRTCTTGDTVFEASLERFALQLPPFVPVVAIAFDKVRFLDDNGQRSVDTELADWMFVNALSWLEPVKDLLLGTLGLGAPTFDGGIFIDFDLPIPSLALGVVTVSGLQLGLGVGIPDSGASSLDFGLSSRDDPFTITVFGFGGNGSFGLTVDAAEIVRIEGSLAVTYELAVDVFIVAASLSASVGVFVIYEQGEVELGAYAELAGSLSVLGLVEITGKVMVALSYRVNSKLLRGVAAVTGEVSSLFGKSSVTRDVEVELSLGASSGARLAALAAAPLPTSDPEPAGFGDHFTRPQWNEYCSAFAA